MSQYVIGIDLGTTNSVLAYAPLAEETPQVQILPIPQLVAAGTVESLSALPSFLYLGTAAEAESKSLDLPWSANRDFAIGTLARRQSAEMPDRTVGGAKSWLAHSRVDRHQAILPGNAPDDVQKISPVTASRRYLEHLVAAWDSAMPDAPLAEQVVVLTVPASFDASARELTREAALAAGLPVGLILLEEPQAAVYAWLDETGDRWRKMLRPNDTLLVCDVGGGTTDLTLVGVAEENGELVLRRLAVGNHLLVGGDNMDLTLAHFVSQQFAEQGVQLDPWQSVSLWHSCRAAKEALLAEGGEATHRITIAGRSSRLIGGSKSIEIARQQAADLLLDGFFPQCALTDRPARRRASGFQEIGLPFEADTGITRHLAAFLQAHGTHGAPVRPTHLLFNGGVFKAAGLQNRLLELVGNWFAPTETGSAREKPVALPGLHDLDHAVARGAAAYGLAKQRGGLRIRGGTARSYYVGIETAGLAIPGAPRPLRALCVAPIGMEEGTEADVPSGEIGLVVGEPAQFRFFSSSTRKQDSIGDLVPHWTEEEISETDSLETTLPADDTLADDYVPVKFHARLTELGVFELWCNSTKNDQRWKLEFSVREDTE
ncbi:MAG: Hsp70 family protein [Planctomycetota bacterium]|nr:Hsp70 family protein [Planctomycetota bacterium]